MKNNFSIALTTAAGETRLRLFTRGTVYFLDLELQRLKMTWKPVAAATAPAGALLGGGLGS